MCVIIDAEFSCSPICYRLFIGTQILPVLSDKKFITDEGVVI